MLYVERRRFHDETISKTWKGVAKYMGKEEVRQELIALINDTLPEIGDVSMDADITTEYGINSITLIKLIVASEEKFNVQFTDYELSLDDYPTFGDLAAIINEKLDN